LTLMKPDKLATRFVLAAIAGPFASSLVAGGATQPRALIDALGAGCKRQVAEQFAVPEPDVYVRLSASLQYDLDEGTMPAQELEAYGASFDWTVRGKGANGYCNVDGTGKVTELVQW
jgi:hypothetical protein